MTRKQLANSSNRKKEFKFYPKNLFKFNFTNQVVYCQSVKFKGFRKTNVTVDQAGNFWTNYTDSPATRRKVIMEMSSSSSTSSAQLPLTSGALQSTNSMRRTAGGKSGETTPFSSTTSLASLPNNLRMGAQGHQGGSCLAGTSLAGGPNDILTNPIYQCMSLPENRAKNICRYFPPN